MGRRAVPAQRGLAVFSLSVLAAAAILVAVPTAEAATTRSLAITWAAAGAPAAWKTFDGNPPKTFDIDGDGDQEILAQNDDNNLYIFDSGTGKLLATLKSSYPSGWGARTFNGPEAYSEDGVTHIVQMNSAAYTTSWRFDPAASNATSFAFVKEWQRRNSECYSGAGSDSKPVLGDLDRDGKLEIVVTTEESGVYAIRGNGSLYWKKCISGGNGEARLADLNLDGYLDVVFASDGGVVTAMHGRPSGSCSASPPCPNTMWTFNIRNNYNLSSASVPVGAGIGQLDGLAGPDIVVGARDSHDATDWENDHALLLALSSTGKVLWAKQDLVDGNPLTYTHPIVADAAGDGVNEVYWADWNTIGHKPPYNESEAWKTTGPANFYRYDNAGELVWKHSMSTFWNNKDLALADADGDGIQEILATGPDTRGHEGIWYLDSRTGTPETFVDAYPWQVTRGPVVADLRGDGKMQFVLETGPMATTLGPAVQVFEMGVPYNAVWPHLPASPAVTIVLPPPPPSGEFGATFTIKNPNSWWQELSVVPDSARTIHKAEVRVNNGDWEPMAKSSWGPWTSSKNTPAGTKVDFRAWDTTNNLVSQSAAFTWLDGTLSQPSVPCGCTGPATTTSTSSSSSSSTTTSSSSSSSSSTTTSSSSSSSSSTTTSSSSSPSTTGTGFLAQFSAFRGNEWWVQAQVGTNGPTVAEVHVRIAPDGAWKPLAKQSWGTSPPSWAGSYHFPQGSVLQMRATATDGQVDLSPCRQWIPPSGTDATIVACPGSTTTSSSSPSSSTSSTSSSSSSSTNTGTFQATFTPKAVGNDWWVEVAVSSGETIAKVEASRDGGAYVDLTKQSWGNWAKSIHAPNGTSVVFRATSASGATATSAPVLWT